MFEISFLWDHADSEGIICIRRKSGKGEKIQPHRGCTQYKQTISL